MALETKTKQIGGITYQVTQFPALQAIRLQTRLFKIIGPAFGRMLGSLKTGSGTAKDGDDEVQIDGWGMAEAVESLFSQLDEATFESLLKNLLAMTVATGIPGDQKAAMFDEKNFEQSINLCFSGSTLNIYMLILFVLEVNYPDFFKAIPAIGTRFGIATTQGATTAGN